jgi:hypothetical protein
MRVFDFTIAFLALAMSAMAAAAEPPRGVSLPETEYQAARTAATARYMEAITACGFINWSTRDACERAALNDLERADLEARNRYLKAQADFREPERKPNAVQPVTAPVPPRR